MVDLELAEGLHVVVKGLESELTHKPSGSEGLHLGVDQGNVLGLGFLGLGFSRGFFFP